MPGRERPDAEPLEPSGDPPVDLPAGVAAEAQAESHVVVDGAVGEQRILEHHGQPAAECQPVPFPLGNRAAEQLQSSRPGPLQQREHPEEGGLAGPVGTEQRQGLALGQVQPVEVEHPLAPVGDHQALGAHDAQRLALRCCSRVSPMAMMKVSPTSTTLSAIARSKLPLPVSSTVAVVRTLV